MYKEKFNTRSDVLLPIVDNKIIISKNDDIKIIKYSKKSLNDYTTKVLINSSLYQMNILNNELAM